MSFMDQMNAAAEGNDTEFEPLPESSYTASLAEVTTEMHPDDGIYRTSLEFHIVEGAHSSRRVWDKVKHSDNVLWKAGSIFKGMGIDATIDGWDEWGSAIYEQKGRRFTITTKNREYNGKTYTGVAAVSADDGVPF
jgi:hypothetical protein